MPSRKSTSRWRHISPNLNAKFCFIRNKTSRVFLLLIVTFLFLSLFEKTLEPLESMCIPKENSDEWSELSVPGQVRNIRIRTLKSRKSPSAYKIILLWTKYFSEEYSNDFYFFQEGQETFIRYNCEISNCYVTSNRSMLQHADAVLFHAKDFNASDIPQRSSKDQIWIIYSMEPPRYMHLKWKLLRSLFNWTMTYRSDSHIPVKYGEIIKTNKSCKTIDFVDLSKKNKDAIWMVSNCRTESKREAYVRELRKSYKVDVYGKCSRMKCEPSQSMDCYELLKNYKYYLSFENSICLDYVTEKFFNVLQYDIVPVVFGGVNYSRIAPPGSFIDATRFPNPKDLANHLEYIGKNSSLYNSFFNWKKYYTIHLHPWMCDLCQRLNNREVISKKLPNNLYKWWVKSSNCRRWSKEKGFHNIYKMR